MNQILQLAERVLGIGAWAFEESEINEGTLHLCACVKAYGDGYSEYYDSRYPDECEIRKAPAFAEEIMRRRPDIKRVSITIHHD